MMCDSNDVVGNKNAGGFGNGASKGYHFLR